MQEGMTIDEAVVCVFEEDVGEDRKPVTQETTFGELGVTKLGLTMQVMKLERAFGAELPVEEEELFREGDGTLGDLVRKSRLYLPDGARVRGQKKAKPKNRWKLPILRL